MVLEGDKHSEELIVELVKKASGVGQGKANALAQFLENDWDDFLQADEIKLARLETAKGRQMLTDEQIGEILQIKAEFQPFQQDVRSAWIYHIGKEFLESQLKMLQSIQLGNLDINPLLMKILNFKTSREVLAFNLYQTVTRSIVTSWGSAVENLLVRCGAEKFTGQTRTRTGRKPDIEKTVGGRKNYIQVKSGPNTMNIDMVNSLNEVIEEYRINEPNTNFLLGMTYGREERISSQIRSTLNDFGNSILIGRQLWDFVSETNDFHMTLFEILDRSSCSITSKSFSEQLEERLNCLVEEWQDRFNGKTIDEALDNCI